MAAFVHDPDFITVTGVVSSRAAYQLMHDVLLTRGDLHLAGQIMVCLMNEDLEEGRNHLMTAMLTRMPPEDALVFLVDDQLDRLFAVTKARLSEGHEGEGEPLSRLAADLADAIDLRDDEQHDQGDEDEDEGTWFADDEDEGEVR